MSKTNHVRLIGHLGQEPKMVSQNNDNIVLSVTLATSTKFKDAQGNKQEKTEWHNIVAFGKIATLINTHLKKGSFVMIEGHLQTRQYQDKEQKNRYSTEIICEEVLFLDKNTVKPEPATN